MEHYFRDNPSAPTEERVVRIEVRGFTVELVTDRGVFSKAGLDEGTRRLIESVDLTGAASALDLGCGYGPVTAILARAYAGVEWWMIDVNRRAVELARRNTMDLVPPPKVIEHDGIPAQLEVQFDHVLMNPPIRAGKATVFRLYEEARRALKPGGKLWVVIQKKHGAPSTEAKLRELFEQVDIAHRKAGYYVFCAVRQPR
ncbi:MAG: methyltransferase [Alicyclobacillus mali]|uniref:class I SAM-dependent methyltransferase n=1 Tax=Alicyclobacillus mali (ex Roth et al. 2021) TaxID=1123961 RepID=UPI0023F593ED|nr:methyltransferase [Alicyclobacillus mali (ex Roth et al. 2021)]MCL6489737.1 methyltransferase [Alicyclobacillus mali (ex Roth et al. 2021)]